MKLPQTWFSSRHQNCCSLYRDHATVTNKSLFDIVRTTKVRFCSAVQVRSPRSFDFWHMASEKYTSSRVMNGFVKWFLCDFQWWFTTLLFGNSEITFCFKIRLISKLLCIEWVQTKNNYWDSCGNRPSSFSSFQWHPKLVVVTRGRMINDWQSKWRGVLFNIRATGTWKETGALMNVKNLCVNILVYGGKCKPAHKQSWE